MVSASLHAIFPLPPTRLHLLYGCHPSVVVFAMTFDSPEQEGMSVEQYVPFVWLSLAVGLLIWGLCNLAGENRVTKNFAVVATALGVGLLAWFLTTLKWFGPSHVAILGVGLLILGVIKPAVGRRFARIFAVIAMGSGVGLLIWGIVGASRGGTLRPPFGIDLVTEASEGIACGAGLLTSGIIALVLSYVGSGRRAASPEITHSRPEAHSPSSSG